VNLPDFYCDCDREAVILVIAGCSDMHVCQYNYCERHLSPVTVPPCLCGKTYLELLIKYLLTGEQQALPIPERHGSEAIVFSAAIKPK
jgi:hypothetical protein